MSVRIEGFCDQMVRAGEIRMHNVVGGKGPPLVLIHGFPQTWWEWRRVMPRLAETHTVVAVDLRGGRPFGLPAGRLRQGDDGGRRPCHDAGLGL